MVLICRFFDIKFLVACSSVVHIGLLWPLIRRGRVVGAISRMFIMVGHGLISYILFFLVSTIYELSHSRSIVTNKSMESHSKNFALVFFLYLFLNLGLPPFIRFLAELFFCTQLCLCRSFGLLIFGIFILGCIFFVIFFVTKLLFGKKSLAKRQRLCRVSFLYPFLYTPFIFFLPFLY